jgi:predicted nucleotidyltransferase component of viral defense system
VIPQASITAWRSIAPWADDAQVEQDLILSRAVVDLFAEPSISDKIALRGGTALNKLFIRPPSRYSEDIDLVQTTAGAIGPLLDSIRARLDSWLGRPKRSSTVGGVALVYRFESEIAPVRSLRLKIEINTREHFSVLGFRAHTVAVTNPWYTQTADVATYELDELLGTKLRALYQRRKGRDLFDLWLCLDRGLLNADRVVACFAEYMEREQHAVSRAEFERNLHDKLTDTTFLGDVSPLLAANVSYDARAAMALVQEELISRLPGDPWRGVTGTSDESNRKQARRPKPRRRRDHT